MNKKEFKQFCEDNNLRYKKDACGDSHIGVYVERETKKKFTFLKQKLVSEYGLRLHQEGDTDGTFCAYTKKATLTEHSTQQRNKQSELLLSLAVLRMLYPKQQGTR
jgi:hypothetical protein